MSRERDVKKKYVYGKEKKSKEKKKNKERGMERKISRG
jgi:hypothetical protein